MLSVGVDDIDAGRLLGTRSTACMGIRSLTRSRRL